MNQRAERRVNTVIGGKWRVDGLLGSGSMAAVYAVTHRNGSRAALKILHAELCTDPTVCERFLGEGYLANSVKHSGIVRVLDDGVTDDGCVFLVMELLEGQTLEELRQLRGGRIDLVETLELADKLMGVLGAVHGAGIVHRDLKPQNVFVCDDGTLKLLDFGVARVPDRGARRNLSMVGLVLGTPSFMSPEQALGARDKIDHRSDIWSLGATLFTALAGETVHLGGSVQAKLIAAATVKARSILMPVPDLPLSVASAIDIALRPKKEDRWQSVDAMRRTLRDARHSLSFPAAPRSFDVSLDEATHIDTGAPLRLGSSTQALHPASRAAPQVVTATMPPLAPSRPPMGSTPEGRFPSAPPIRASRPDGRDGSIPAYGGTLSERRSNNVAVWFAVVVLAAAAASGVAFFAVRRGPLAGRLTGRSLRPPVATATAAPTAPPTVPSAAPSPDDSSTPVGKPADVDALPPMTAKPTPPKPPGVGRLGPRPRGKPVNPEGPFIPDPQHPPPLPPDPFGTPE